MLVLSRKKNEAIVVDNNITVLVVDIRGDKVRLGVSTPPDVPVHRREVYDAIREHEDPLADDGLVVSGPEVRLSPRHLELLDRLAGSPGAEASRASALAAILDAVDELTQNAGDLPAFEALRSLTSGAMRITPK